MKRLLIFLLFALSAVSTFAQPKVTAKDLYVARKFYLQGGLFTEKTFALSASSTYTQIAPARTIFEFVDSVVALIPGGGGGGAVASVNALTGAVVLDLSRSSNTLSLTGDGSTVDLSPYLDNTDAQTLSLGSNLLVISGGNNVSLASYLDNTDAQTLSLATNTLSISGGNNVSLAGYLDNTDAQDLSLSGNTLSLTGDGTPVSLAAYLDDTDTDDQTLSWNGSTGEISIDGGNSVDLDGRYLQVEVDGSTTNENQTVSAGTGISVNQVGQDFAVTNTGDTDASNDLTTSTSFSGDVSGNYNSTAVADDSHNHAASTISTNIVSSLDGVTNDGGDIDLVAGANITLTPDDGANTITIAASGGGGSPSVISPSQITSDQDNYNPTGFGASTVVRLDGDNGIRAITSMNAETDGEEKQLINIGSYPIYFPMDHPDGTAANRFTGCAKDFILMPGASARVMYDGTSSRWRFLDPSAQANVFDGKGVYYSASAGSSTAGDWGEMALQAINSGTVSGTAASSGFPACWQISSASTTNGGGSVYFAKTALQFTTFGDAQISATSTISIPTLSDATDTYTAFIAITQSPNANTLAVNNTIGIRYTHGTNSGKWEGFTRNTGGSETPVDLGVTVAANTIYNLRIEYDKSGTEARFYVNGVMRGRVTATLPSAVACGFRSTLIKSAGSTARTLNVHSLAAQAIYP